MFKPVFVILSAMLSIALAYDLVYDDYDYEGMMDNTRMLNGMVACLLQDDECENPIFQEVKKYAPEILETVCGKCTEKQKAQLKICTNKFIRIRPDDYEKIMKKLDPNGQYRGPFEDFLHS